MLKRLLTVLLWLASCLSIVQTKAQTTQAGITGVVVDEEKNPLPGATVFVKNESTGFTTGTATNANGEFTFKQLPLGGLILWIYLHSVLQLKNELVMHLTRAIFCV
jgi:hypothetical protein